MAAIPKFSFQPAVQSIFANHLNSNIIDENDEINYDYILDNQIIGPWWIHIGDDFIKDIVAANELGIRSIWCQELVKEKLRINEKKIKHESESEKRDVSDFMREVTENGGYLSMKIGSDVTAVILNLSSAMADCNKRSIEDPGGTEGCRT